MICKVVGVSETGKCRRSNQDAILVTHTEQMGFFAVADGIGGHYRGEVASQETIRFLQIWWDGIKDKACSVPFLDLICDLERELRKINEIIYQMYQKMEKHGGTTLCVLLICGNAYAILNVGDSRLYRCQGVKCVQMTVDDVWENQPQIRWMMKDEDLCNNPLFGRLVQALGANKELRISVRTGCIARKTQFLLCSDGIYKYCEEALLLYGLRKVRHKRDVSRLAEKVKMAVCENGAGDNYSMIIILTDIRRVK